MRKTSIAWWVIAAIVCVRYAVLAEVRVAVVRCVHKLLYQYVLMLQFAMPPEMCIITMAHLYDVAQEECFFVFIWTYLVATLALTAWSNVFMSILAT